MSKKETKYNKKVTISLSEEDFKKLEKIAEDDRRTIQQKASFMVEDAIDSLWIAPEAKNENNSQN